jgi:hypothetical protein
MTLEQYKVTIIATTISTAVVFVDALSVQDAHEIAKESCKKEDFEVEQILKVDATESEVVT